MELHHENPLSVLLVEDNAVDVRLIRGLLRAPSEQIKFQHASSLSEALEALRENHFDVVLLDLKLEDSSGYQTFAQVRQNAARSAILVLSGSDDEELAITTVREGAQDYLVKGSFDGRLLLRSIRYALERKRSEDSLRQSEATVRAIFEHSLDGIVIFDEEGTCLEANAAAATLMGVAREQLSGKQLSEFGAAGLVQEWRRLGRYGSGRGQAWLQNNGGGKRLVEFGCCANILPGQHLSVLRDITEQHGLEQQLRQSQKMEAVGRLAGGVAHDFNNILGIISGYAELMQMDRTNGSNRDRAEKILSATEKAALLTRQLLAFGRKQVMSPEVLDLYSIFAGLSSMVKALIGAEVQLQVVTGGEVGLVKADQSQLEQVVLNLIANARDAMPNGGTLKVSIEDHPGGGSEGEVPEGKYVRMSVADTGSGMDPEVQSRIFEPFFSTKRSGSGLGLSTVYGIVKQSGGHITVESELDKGTTFRIYLPRVAGDQKRPAVKLQGATSELGGSETILLADNEDDLRNAATEYLEGCGYRVLKARDGKEAIEIADGHQGAISLLISDIVMPRVNGRGLVEHLRKTRPETGVLIISGYADDAVLRHGIELESTCFLQKPFTFQALGEKIRKVLDRD